MASSNGNCRLLGKVSAWYEKEGRGWIFRHIADLPTTGDIPVVQGEHYTFTANDVEDGSIPMGRNVRVAFSHAGRNKCGQWMAEAITALKDSASASDGAPGRDAAQLFSDKPGTKASGDTKSESGELARLKRKAKEYLQLEPHKQEEVVKEMSGRLQDILNAIEAFGEVADNKEKLPKRLMEASALLLPPRSRRDVTDAESALYAAQKDLRKVLVTAIKLTELLQTSDATKLVTTAFEYIRSLISKFEKSNGSKLAKADVCKYWVKLAALIKDFSSKSLPDSEARVNRSSSSSSAPAAAAPAPAAAATPPVSAKDSGTVKMRSSRGETKVVTKLAFANLGGQATLQEVIACIKGDARLYQRVQDIEPWQEIVEKVVLKLCTDTGKRRKQSASEEITDPALRPVIYQLLPDGQ